MLYVPGNDENRNNGGRRVPRPLKMEKMANNNYNNNIVIPTSSVRRIHKNKMKLEEPDPLAINQEAEASKPSNLITASQLYKQQQQQLKLEKEALANMVKFDEVEDVDIQIEAFLQCSFCGHNFLTWQSLNTHNKLGCDGSKNPASSSSSTAASTNDMERPNNGNNHHQQHTAATTMKSNTSERKNLEKGRPKIPNIYLAALALKNSRNGALTTEKIYRFITKTFPYYRQPHSKLEKREEGNWKRHLHADLKQSDILKKIVQERDPGSKGSSPNSNNSSSSLRSHPDYRVLWSVDGRKGIEFDKSMIKWLKQNRGHILRTMEQPQQFLDMVNGNLDLGLDSEEEEDPEEQEKRQAAIIANFFAKPSSAKKSTAAAATRTTTSRISTTTLASPSVSLLPPQNIYTISPTQNKTLINNIIRTVQSSSSPSVRRRLASPIMPKPSKIMKTNPPNITIKSLPLSTTSSTTRLPPPPPLVKRPVPNLIPLPIVNSNNITKNCIPLKFITVTSEQNSR